MTAVTAESRCYAQVTPTDDIQAMTDTLDPRPQVSALLGHVTKPPRHDTIETR
jgi:hypothetical protein